MISMTHVLHMRQFDMALRMDFTYQFSKEARIEEKALKVIHEFTNSVIVSRRKQLLLEMQQEKDKVSTDNDVGMKKKMPLLDILLQSTVDGKELTNEDIREEVGSFMFAGHDTTTSGITFTLYCLAKHPKVQEKVIKEIHEVMGKDIKKPITLQMLNELHYMDLVLKEVLRMFPSVPMIGRAIDEDVEISEFMILRMNLITAEYIFISL